MDTPFTRRDAARATLGALTLPLAMARPGQAPTAPPDRDVLAHFLALADVAAAALMPEPPDRDGHRKSPGMRDYHMFFVDSYAVRALAVAYDLTRRERYWDACRAWCDRMLRHQEKMLPAGAYYMNYHRKPGESSGEWFVADCGSIAMAVLAAGARAKDEALRRRYFDSVAAYLKLVASNFVRASGGVTDGYYEKSDKEWWCSTALYGATALQYHGLAGDRRYLQLGLRTVDWLLDFEYAGTQELYTFEAGAPTTIFYVLEAYASALPYLDPGSERHRKVFARFAQTAEWIAYTQNRQGTWNYNPDNWGVKLGGFPAHLLIYLRHAQAGGVRRRPVLDHAGDTIPFEQMVDRCARRAQAHFASLPPNPARFTQKEAFVLISEAERLCPGELYQKRKLAFPCRSIEP
jgi:hypothetical protein